MKKRLRKKLRLREFNAPQWWISCKFHPGLTEGQADVIKERFSAVANVRGFRVFRAGSAISYSFILDRWKAPTEAQRQYFASYLHGLPEVASVEDKGLGYL